MKIYRCVEEREPPKYKHGEIHLNQHEPYILDALVARLEKKFGEEM
jgi:hypothetical protein